MKDFFKAVRWNLLAVLFTALAFTFIGCETEATASSEPVYYIVSVQDGIQNGTVVVLSSTTCKAGTTVTLQANPDEGYKLSTFIVTDKNGNSVTVTENTFIMPKSDVTVSASFVKDESNSGSEGGESGEGGSQGGETEGEGGESGEGGENQGGTGGQGEGGESGGQTGGEGQQGTGGEGQGTGTEGQGEGQGGGITEGENQGSGTGGETGGEGEGGETPEPKECWIGFNINQPTDSYTTGSMSSIKSTIGEEISLTENAFSVSGYNFKEWNTKRDGSGQSYQDKEKITLTEEMYSQSDWVTLYAIWEPASDTKYIVYHYLEPTRGIEYSGSYAFDKEEELTGTTGGQTQAKALSYPGFTVLDFEQETIIAPNPNKSEDERYTKVSIYYKRNAHTISFDANAGEDEISLPEDISEPVNTRFGAEEELYALLEDRPSYNFAGWNTKADGSGSTYTPDKWGYLNITMEDQNLVLYAQWTPITAKLTIETGSREYTIQDKKESNYSSKHLLSVNTDLKIPAADFIWEIDGKAITEFTDETLPAWLTVGKDGSNDGTITVDTYSWKQGSMHHISVKSIVNGRIYSSSISISKPRSTN